MYIHFLYNKVWKKCSLCLFHLSDITPVTSVVKFLRCWVENSTPHSLPNQSYLCFRWSFSRTAVASKKETTTNQKNKQTNKQQQQKKKKNKITICKQTNKRKQSKTSWWFFIMFPGPVDDCKCFQNFRCMKREKLCAILIHNMDNMS